MLEAPEIETHRHRTGHSRVDLIFGALAIVLSGISVYIAISHGRTMERLVAANTWPNVSYDTSNADEQGTTDVITLDLRNTGVGPARVETFELFYKNQPIASPKALMLACCGHGHYTFSTSSIRNVVLPARETIHFIGLRRDQNRPEVWDALNQERLNIRVRACYCSVFDECWVEDSAAPRPERTAQCVPSQPVQFSN